MHRESRDRLGVALCEHGPRPLGWSCWGWRRLSFRLRGARSAATDWSGTYDGTFTDAKTSLQVDEVYTNHVHFEVNNLELAGGFEVQTETAQHNDVASGSTGLQLPVPSITIALCLSLNVSLTGGELRGIPIPSDEVDWSGSVPIQVGVGDPKTFDCTKKLPTKETHVKLDVTVGSSGLRGTVGFGDIALPFTADRTSGVDTTTPTSSVLTDPHLGELVGVVDGVLGPQASSEVRTAVDTSETDTAYTRLQWDQSMVDAVKESAAANPKVAGLVATAVMLAAVQRCTADCFGRHPVTTAVFPNVRALGPVFAKLAGLAIHGADNDVRDRSLRALRRLLNLALTLETINR